MLTCHSGQIWIVGLLTVLICKDSKRVSDYHVDLSLRTDLDCRIIVLICKDCVWECQTYIMLTFNESKRLLRDYQVDLWWQKKSARLSCWPVRMVKEYRLSCNALDYHVDSQLTCNDSDFSKRELDYHIHLKGLSDSLSHWMSSDTIFTYLFFSSEITLVDSNNWEKHLFNIWPLSTTLLTKFEINSTACCSQS
jgi:hypothetical protein